MKTTPLAVRIAAAAMTVFFMTGMVAAQAQQVKTGPALQTAAPAPGPHKTNIAVINLKSSSGVAIGEAELISDRLRGELFNTGKVNVMERDQMQEILKEQGFQQSGACSNEACMVEIGQLLGVEQLVSGSLGKVGSMFLVNLRIIDVKTAKITKVVSKDVKGSIEDVVGELGPIAAELVGNAGAPPAPAVVERRTVEAEQPKPEPAAEEQRVVSKEEPAPDERAEKNKNRAGIRMAFNIFPGNVTTKLHVTYYDTYGISTSSHTFNEMDSGYTSSPMINPQLKFFFKAGPVISIDIGPSYTFGSMEQSGLYYDYGNYLNVFGFAVGVNFVKRWYPVKMNIGAMIDFNYLLNMEEWKSNSMYYTQNSDSTAFHNSVNVSYGLRAGAEFMAGKHVGFNLDFLFKYSYFETMEEEYDFPDGSYNKYFVSYLLPMFGIGFGVNFYY
jgi:curli biogenesis system outer membrane secretion channel CsgG